MKRKWIESYDVSIAQGLFAANASLDGLPGFLGAQFAEFGPGRLRIKMPVRPELLTPFGSLHGGVLAALCDHALGCVCYPHMRRGHWAATTEFKLNYLAPVRSGTVQVEAQIVSMTRTTAVVRIDVHNEDRLAAVAQGTVLIREGPAASSERAQSEATPGG